MAERGEFPAVDIVRRAGQRLGIRVAHLVNLLNPQMVIIGGGIEQAGTVLLDEIRAAVTEWCYEETASTVKIIPSHLGDDSVALGAASFIIRKLFAEIKD
jgi:glucokinase